MTSNPASNIQIVRFEENPLLTPETAEEIGTNINGPSVIQVPEWIPNPLGTYYLYFANHGGTYIRLAYADNLRGPWKVYAPGTLHIEDTRFTDHIASPDVHVDEKHNHIRLYFHGCCGPFEHSSGSYNQVTDVATSTDGLQFTVQETTLGNSYFRVWEYEDKYYAIANDGYLYQSSDPLQPFDRLHELFPHNRHFGIRKTDQDTLQLFLTRRGDRPERIQVVELDLAQPINEWVPNPHPPESVLWPKHRYEGGDVPVSTSSVGAADERVQALRDPTIFEEDGRTYIFYAIAGERGIAGGEIRSPS